MVRFETPIPRKTGPFRFPAVTIEWSDTGTLFPEALFHGYAIWRNLKVGGLLKRLFNSVVRHGTLTVIRPDGSTLDFGSGPPHVAIRIHDRPALLELALNPDLKLGELYMDGRLTVEDGDIAALLDL